MAQSDCRTANDDRVLSITVSCVMTIINSSAILLPSIPVAVTTSLKYVDTDYVMMVLVAKIIFKLSSNKSKPASQISI